MASPATIVARIIIMAILLSAVGMALFIGIVANTSRQPFARAPVADVLVMRDLNAIRFANDSDLDFFDCRVTISGGLEATLDQLKAKGRGYIDRDKFGEGMPRDEFYKRQLQGIAMVCHDDSGGDNQGRAVQIRLK